MKPIQKKHKFLFWLLLFVVFITPVHVKAVDEQEYQGIEPNEYVQKQIEMNLSKYAEQNNRSANSLPEEQLVLTFEQQEQQEEQDMVAQLFTTPFADDASFVSEVERYELFAEVFSTQSQMAIGETEEEGTFISISTLLIGAVVGLVALLFIWLLPRLNIEQK